MTVELVSKGLTLRSLNIEQRSVDFIASSEAVDSYDEIVEQTWDLTRYRANPVVLYGHQSRELPIGTCTHVEVRDKELHATLKFLPAEANPVAEQVWLCLREGALRAVSVGFRPKTVRYEKRNGKDVYVLSDNELHEISVVPIPANPEALAKMRSKARADATHHTQRGGAPAAGDKTMSYATIAVMLGMTAAAAAGATEHDVATAAKSAKDKADKADALEKERDAARTEAAALKAHSDTLVKERDAALAQKKSLEDKVVDGEVTALIGKKISAAEKDTFVELAKTNRQLFEKMVEQRADMKLLGGPAMGPDPKAPPPSTSGDTDDGASLAALLQS